MVRPVLPGAVNVRRIIIIAAVSAVAVTAYAAIPTWSRTGVNDKSWILDTGAGKVATKVSSPGCAPGMQRVKGDMRQDDPQRGSVQELQSSVCLHWIPPFVNGRPVYPERCIEFDEPRWRAIVPHLATKPIDVCIDTYEYPNQEGQNPLIAVTYPESQSMCVAQGKRLCTEDEWTFACEGPDATPYPYGFKRDKVACNIDKSWRVFSESKLGKRGTDVQRDELARLWQGEPSGSRPACVSLFGVHDLTGNVDEWTTASRPSKHPSILKGGYWGPVRTRCRPTTRNHGPGHYFYQQGFRCCSDPTSKGDSK